MSRDVLKALSAPFPAHAVSWRVGRLSKDKTKATALAYVDARDVMDRLDEVCGAEWQDDIRPASDGTFVGRIGIRIGGEWVWRGDGTSSVNREITGDDNRYKRLDEIEMHEKGAYSDAFKRAAVKWGIGRFLYDIESPWVAVDEWKQIKPTERGKLDKAVADAIRRMGGAADARQHAEQQDEPQQREPVRAVQQAPATAASGADHAEHYAKTDPHFWRMRQMLNAATTQDDINAVMKAENNVKAYSSWPAEKQQTFGRLVVAARERIGEMQQAA